jgi:hypothetical protein
MRKIFILLLIISAFQLFASQRNVVGEVFSNDPGC